MSKRINIAKWYEKYSRWQIKVSKDGQRRTFTDPTPGREGMEKCHQKADDWLSLNINPNMRVDVLYNAFLADQQVRTGTGNYTNNESIGRVWIIPEIGSKKMSKVSEQDLQNILNKAHKKKRSKKTISNIRGAITAFLRYARKANATKLRADDLEIPRNAHVGERKVLESDHINVLFTSTRTRFNKKEREEWYIHAFRFLAAVGLRPGELCELQQKKQKSNTNVAVHGSYNRFLEHTPGKNRNAIRTFALPSLAVDILKDQKIMLKKAGVISGYMFPDRNGFQTTSRNLYKRWKRYQIENGLADEEKKGISLYELRHTFVSMCKRKVPEALIKPFLGHSSKMPSYDTYGHEMSDEMDIVAQTLNDIFNDILK